MKVVWQHCVMRHFYGGMGGASDVNITYLDKLDKDGYPISEKVEDQFQGFHNLGLAGWQLVQLFKEPYQMGDFVTLTTYYFKRRVKQDKKSKK